ncbi:MAG: substrate-binding domain-containing protein [Burkholderiaceae bacterium]
MNLSKISVALGLSAAVLVSAPAVARDNVQIAGSSTVLPFASIVAEEFGKSFSQFKTPVVGSGGSSGGIRQFCQGVGANTIDIANASRKIKSDEVKACAEKGVKKVIEVKIGYDGIVFSSRRDSGKFALPPDHIYLATAAQVPQGCFMVANPYTNWSQIDKSLPNQMITLAIPASNHGTREVFEEKTLIDGCKKIDYIAGLMKSDKKGTEKACKAVRKDGRVIEIAGDYTETLAKLNADKDAVGVFGLSFYEANRDKLQVATVSGVTPTLETVESGKYPVSRPLYFYIKDAHIGVIPGLQEYAKFFLSAGVSGMGSPLEKAGLVPLNDKERKEVLAAIEGRKGL